MKPSASFRHLAARGVVAAAHMPNGSATLDGLLGVSPSPRSWFLGNG